MLIGMEEIHKHEYSSTNVEEYSGAKNMKIICFSYMRMEKAILNFAMCPRGVFKIHNGTRK